MGHGSSDDHGLKYVQLSLLFVFLFNGLFHVICSITHLYIHVFLCSVFWMSGFKRTLCGGEWQSLSSDSGLTSGVTGRLGCCPAGSFMSNPMLNPFSVANSCQQCPAGTGPVSSNDETQWIDECPADAVTPSSAAGATTHEKASNSKSIHTVMIGIMIAFVSVIFSNAW